jgi:hypothetical protein
MDIGTSSFDADSGHTHIHIDHWAHYSLRTHGLDSLKPESWPIVAQGNKIGFCAIDYLECAIGYPFCENYGIPVMASDLPNYPFGYGKYNICEDTNSIQGISVGWADVYASYLPGQEIPLSDSICNGNYYIVSIFDPDTLFKDFDKKNNVASALITLSKQTPNCCKAKFTIDSVRSSARLDTVQFIDNTIPLANNWLWDFGDGFTNNEQHPKHVYADSGNHPVSLVTSNSFGCSDSFSMNIHTIPSASEEIIVESFNMNIVPNPFSHWTSLEYELKNEEFISIEIYNLLGQKIQSVLSKQKQKTGNYKYEVSLQKQGFYLLKISTSRQSFTLPLICLN